MLISGSKFYQRLFGRILTLQRRRSSSRGFSKTTRFIKPNTRL